MSTDPRASSGPLYLDHAATSPLRPRVWEAMREALGAADHNAASTHGFGQRARDRLERARLRLARCLETDKRDVYFTGGGTQSDNLAILGFARARGATPGGNGAAPARGGERPRILVSDVEHRAVLEPAERAAREGALVERIPVDAAGVLDLDALEERLAGGGGEPALVSVMWANNEVGVVQPVARACEIAHAHGALFHTDAVQALGKRDVSLAELPADLLTATAHKLGGPVGIGLLYARRDLSLEPLTYGGTQERSMWPGTQNPLAAVGFAEAAALAVEELPGAASAWREMRDHLADQLREEIPDLAVQGEGASERLPNLLNVGIPGCDQSMLLLTLDMEGVAVSSGSACSSGAVSPSHVLEAMGAPGPDEQATLRFSFGAGTSREDVERAAGITARVVSSLRSRAPARTGA